MTDRDTLARAFVAATDWAAARLAPLAGDASNRRYLRLRLDTRTAVLMDAPPEKGEDVRPFIAIAEYLTGLGLSAPRILARDTEAGFLLLEDLGDALFARAIPADPGSEALLYATATDLLVALHRAAPPAGLAAYDAPVMADMAALAFDWYAGQTTGFASETRAAFHAEIKAVLARTAPGTPVLIQRDYHAENLLWLPDRDGVARVGLLDFQDAMLGHAGYDLVSLLQDARRDVPTQVEARMIARYTAATGTDPDAFDAAYHALGAQRNLRILGVFARLCLRDGKAHYVDLIPRVWGLLQRDLAHPALAPLRRFTDTLPAPTPDILNQLKSKCATVPHP